MALPFGFVTPLHRWVRWAASGVLALAVALLVVQVWAAPFVGIQDVQLSQTADKQLHIRFDTDFPLTYSLSVAGINRMELVFPQARLADGVRNHLSQRGIMVGLQRLEWQDEGALSRLVLEGPQLATRRLMIEGATPSMIQSTGAAPEAQEIRRAPSPMLTPPPEPRQEPQSVPAKTQPKSGPVLTAVSLAQPPTTQSPMPNYSASQLVEQATQAYNAGNISAALSLAKAATQKAPNNSAVWGSYGELLIEEHAYPEAVLAFRQALSQSQGSQMLTQQQVFLDRLAVAYRKITPANLAADELASVLQLYPQASESLVLAHWMLGELYFDAGRLDDAEAALTKAAGLENDNSDLLTQLGLVYEMQGKAAQATRLFRQALQQDESHTLARQGLVRLAPMDPALGLGDEDHAMTVRTGQSSSTSATSPETKQRSKSVKSSSAKRPQYSHLYRHRALQSVGGGFRPNY